MEKDKFSLEQLTAEIKQKIADKNPESYSYLLASKGVEQISRKVGEEAIEVVVAAFVDEKKHSAKTRSDLVGEVCDLFYHSLVLLAIKDIEFEEILSELNRRNKIKK